MITIIRLVIFLSISMSLNANSIERLTDNPKYREILINYSKILLEEACFSSRIGGCEDKALESISNIQFELSRVGEYSTEEGIVYYSVSPSRDGGTAYTMFFRKTSGSLEQCGSAQTIEKFEDVVKHIESKKENPCAIAEEW